MDTTTRCPATNKTGDQCRFVKGHLGSHGYRADKYNKALKGLKGK